MGEEGWSSRASHLSSACVNGVECCRGSANSHSSGSPPRRVADRRGIRDGCACDRVGCFWPSSAYLAAPSTWPQPSLNAPPAAQQSSSVANAPQPRVQMAWSSVWPQVRAGQKASAIQQGSGLEQPSACAAPGRQHSASLFHWPLKGGRGRGRRAGWFVSRRGQFAVEQVARCRPAPREQLS